MKPPIDKYLLFLAIAVLIMLGIVSAAREKEKRTGKWDSNDWHIFIVGSLFGAVIVDIILVEVLHVMKY